MSLIDLLLLSVSVRLVVCNFFDGLCSNVFQYRYDSNSVLFGYLVVDTPQISDSIQLDVQLSLESSVEGYDGSIDLVYSRKKTIEDIIKRRPIHYRINFPYWVDLPPKVVKILVNGNPICLGSATKNSLQPFFTIIDLQHKLQLHLLPPTTAQNNKPEVTPSHSVVSPASRMRFNSVERVSDLKPIFNLPTTSRGSYTSLESRFSSFQPAPVKKDSDSFVEEISLGTKDICGTTFLVHSLIVSGNDASIQNHPWLTALFRQDSNGLSFICGGSLVSNKHVITAAHCIQNRIKRLRPDQVVVVLGRENIHKWTTREGVAAEVKSITIHPDYHYNSADADIAVLSLKDSISFTRFIRPVCLWSGHSDLHSIVGSIGMTAGWGRSEKSRRINPEPKQVVLPIASQEDCLRSNAGFKEITSSRTFCAGYRNNSGPCTGDSGGGFVLAINGKWTLRGITSLSIATTDKSCDLKHYVVFTDLAKFSSWLRRVLI